MHGWPIQRNRRIASYGLLLVETDGGEMSETYKLERIVDLLQVPTERREQCLKEILIGLELAELADAVLMGPIAWTDDGDLSCALTDSNGNAIISLEAQS